MTSEDIVFAIFHRGIVNDMVDTTTGRMDTTATQAPHDFFIVNGYLYDVVHGDVRIDHCLCLGNGAGKTIKQASRRTVGLLKSCFYQVDDQIVRDQAATVHNAFGLQSQLVAFSHGCTQHSVAFLGESCADPATQASAPHDIWYAPFLLLLQGCLRVFSHVED